MALECKKNILPIPFSAGRLPPKHKAPFNACDCHHHIYDSRFPASADAVLFPPDATVADYRLVQRWIGTTRNVIVTPSTYGTDNSCLLDALKQFGGTARGIAVVNTDITADEIEKLNLAGVRGIRFQAVRSGASISLNMLVSLAERINEYGWHLDVHMSADMIAENEYLLNNLPVPVVFDHLGRIPQPEGISHPAFRVICRIIDKGRGWVKLSGIYHDSKIGSPSYVDTVKIAKAYVDAAPERVIWGTDWPYPAASAGERPFPDVGVLFDCLVDYVQNEKTLQQILVKNPKELYGFSK